MSDQSSEFLAKAAAEPVQLSIHDLLAVWGFRYRDFDSVGRIQRDLAAAGLCCEPSFKDGPARSIVTVRVVPIIKAPSGERLDGDTPSAAVDRGILQAAQEDDELVLPEVAWLVSDVPSATAGITSLHPSATLEQAQGKMMAHGFSQLAVMTGPTELKGVVSWEGIAKARVANARMNLGDAIDRFPKVVHANQELLDQLGTIFSSGFVFVRDPNDCISGIITNADLTSQFGELTTPFFQLGEIERRIRQCIRAAFSVERLRQVTGKTRLESVDDMMFGQYQRLLNDPDRWRRMHWMLDQETFIEHLDDVRRMRNQIMHFGARPLDDSQKDRLNKFLHIMRYLSPLP